MGEPQAQYIYIGIYQDKRKLGCTSPEIHGNITRTFEASPNHHKITTAPSPTHHQIIKVFHETFRTRVHLFANMFANVANYCYTFVHVNSFELYIYICLYIYIHTYIHSNTVYSIVQKYKGEQHCFGINENIILEIMVFVISIKFKG